MVNHQAGNKRISTILKRIGVSILIFIALDLIAGIFFTGDSMQSFRTKHHYYHHGLLPNQESIGAWGSLVYPVYTNSAGFVDSSAYRLNEESELSRILILGDSHSEGVGVPYLKTFAGRLSSRLKKDSVEVLNASCISYSQKIEYLKVKYIIEEQNIKFDHLFVLVDISDMQNELVYEHFEPAPNTLIRKWKIRFFSFLKKHSAIYSLSNAIIQGTRNKKFFKAAEFFEEKGQEEVQTNSQELYATFFSHFDDKTLLSNPQFHGVSEWYYDEFFRELADHGIEMAQYYMKRLKELCNEKGIELTLSVHPWQTQILKREPVDYYTETWRLFCKAEGIEYVNLFPLFINGMNPVTVNKMYYIQNDNHWNEFGHEKVADTLYSFFRSKLINPVP